MVLFYLFFILSTTIRPKIRVLTDLFLSCTHDHSTEICGILIFIISFVHDHSTKTQGTHILLLFFFLHAHSHLIKICGPLPFIITFVHDHSTKIRGHSYFLIYPLMNSVYISYAAFIAVLIYFVHYIQGRTALIFRTLCPWLYEVLAENLQKCFP